MNWKIPSWKVFTVVVFQRVNLQNNWFHVDFLRKTVFGLYTLFIKIMAWLQGVKKARHDLHLDTSKSRAVRDEWMFYEEKKINIIWKSVFAFFKESTFFSSGLLFLFFSYPRHVWGKMRTKCKFIFYFWIFFPTWRVSTKQNGNHALIDFCVQTKRNSLFGMWISNRP